VSNASCSRHLVEPVTWSLVSSESLFSELLVTSVLHSVDLESVRVAVDEVVLREEVGHWVDGQSDGEGHVDHHLLVWNLGSGDEHEVLRDVMSHLRSRGRSSVIVLNHTIMELWWHSNNHVIVVWIEMSSLWDIKTERWVVVVTGKKVVWVVDQSWVVGCCLGQIWRPDTEVSILGLMDGHVWWPHSIVNNSLSKVPLLEEVTSVFLMSWVNLWKVDHLLYELSLLETLVHKQIVFLMHGSMATLAGSLENLESSSKSGRVVGLEALLRWPVAVTVVHTN